MTKFTDINGFKPEDDFFGFTQMDKSNTSFLNFSIEETDAFKAASASHEAKLKALRDEYYAKADALSVTNTSGKEAIYAELESKLKAENQRFDKEVKKLKQQAGISAATSGLNQISGLMDTLGLKPKSTNPGNTTITTTTPGNQSSGSSKKWLWISLGVISVFGIGVAIYKARKK